MANNQLSGTPSDRIVWSRKSAERIANAVRIVEGMDPDSAPLTFKRPLEGIQRQGILSKTQSTWAIDTSQTLCIYKGEPPYEAATDKTVVAWNKFAEIEPGKWVFLSRANSRWYVVAAQCTPEEPPPE